MGQSTDAILFYGYCWDDEGATLIGQDEDDESEWEEVIAVREGHTNPWDLYRSSGAEAEHMKLPYGPQRDAAFDEWKKSFDFDSLTEKWYAAKAEIKDRYKVAISSHCSCEYPMPYIYVTGTKTRASRGYPKQIDPAKMDTQDYPWQWDDALSTFTDDLGIDLSGAKGPGWFLVSNWC